MPEILKKRIGKFPLWAIIAAAAVVIVFVISCLIYNASADGKLSDKAAKKAIGSYPFIVDFIDVGQGDCELIRSKDKVILIDGGEADEANEVITYIKSQGISEIDCYILSHPHADHIGASAKIIDAFTVDKFLCTDFSEDNIPTTATYQNTLLAMDKSGADVEFVEPGNSFSFGGLKVRIIAPYEESENYNNMSIVCTISYKNVTALFAGDAEQEIEEQILSKNKNLLSADILKISHHGSSTSNTPEFISAVNPDVAVISVGSGNDYGHPHKETLDTLGEQNINYYRTDTSGTVTVYSDGSRIYVNTQK